MLRNIGKAEFLSRSLPAAEVASHRIFFLTAGRQKILLPSRGSLLRQSQLFCPPKPSKEVAIAPYFIGCSPLLIKARR